MPNRQKTNSQCGCSKSFSKGVEKNNWRRGISSEIGLTGDGVGMPSWAYMSRDEKDQLSLYSIKHHLISSWLQF